MFLIKQKWPYTIDSRHKSVMIVIANSDQKTWVDTIFERRTDTFFSLEVFENDNDVLDNVGTLKWNCLKRCLKLSYTLSRSV